MNSSLDDELHYVRRKAAFAFGLFVVALGALGWRLWDLQVRRGDFYYTQAQHEALQPIPIPAARGEILDTNGIVLARDVPSFAAVLSYTPQPLAPAEVSLLAKILQLSPATIEAAAQKLRTGSTFVPQLLRAGLTPAQYTSIAENATRLSGVSVQSQPVRIYPGLPGAGDPGTSLAANVLGYVLQGQTPGDVRGADGVEKSFDSLPGAAKGLGLAGTDGQQIVEVDPQGNPVRRTAVVPPVPGNDVVLTIDAKLQAVAQRALSAQLAALRTRSFPSVGGPFPDAYWGAAVVIDVRTGAILALASEPTFDPNVFASGAVALPGSTAAAAFNRQVSQWGHDLQGRPLTDHAILDAAPPGSTFKPVTAIAALQDGVITASEHLPCPPDIPVGPHTMLKNWIYPLYGGDLDLTEAVARSCDTYFYTVGEKAGIAAIDRVASEFGLGRLTGQHALYGENPGQLSSPAVAASEGMVWVPSYTMQTAIGQGFSLFTPLQMAVYTAALANGGTVFVPEIVREVRTPQGQIVWQQKPQVKNRLALSPAIATAIHQAMAAVTQMHPSWRADQVDADFGTAYWPFYQFTSLTQKYLGRAITIAGKTGTAQTLPGQTPDGWFISFAPANDPQIAVVVMTSHSSEGFVGGAPVAREIYDYYFNLDRAMWKAGAADQIIPSVVQVYFGQSTHYPDWWGPPPAPAATSTATGGPGG